MPSSTYLPLLPAMDYMTFLQQPGSLWKGEIFWKTHYLWLKENGYQLRTRYAPDWTPSWTETNKPHKSCEDGMPLLFGQICDAIHIPTGKHVSLKKWHKKPYRVEEDIHRFLTSEEMLSDPRNNCVPLLEVLTPPDENPEIRILVMPLLRPFDSPLFDTFGEAMECIRQLFEGLQFLHEHHVAHCDLNTNNFMMESQAMFPEGYHPQRKGFDAQDYGLMHRPDLGGLAKFFTRTQRPPRYYIIDFGLSRRYDAAHTNPLEYPVEGGDKTVPEFRDISALHNPYWTDVYYAGNLVRQYFIEGHPKLRDICQGYRGFDFLEPLINDMVQEDPSKRPTMNKVVPRFHVIINNMSQWKLRSRTSWRNSGILDEIGFFFSHWKRWVIFIIKGTPAIPRPPSS